MLKKYLYIIILLPLLYACNEDVNVSIPDRYAQPVIDTFINTSGDIWARPGDIIEIRGKHLGMVDTVRIGAGHINVLQERISDELLITRLVDGVTGGKIYAISRVGGTGESKRSIAISQNLLMPVVDSTSLPTTAAINNVIIVRGRNLQNITRPYFYTGANVFTNFSFQTSDSVGVVVPVLTTNSVKFGFEYATSSTAKTLRTVNVNISINAPSITIATVPSTVTISQRFEITGNNLNLVTGATLGGQNVTLYPNESSAFKLIMKCSSTSLTPGAKSLVLNGNLGATATTTLNVVALPTEPVYTSLLTYTNFILGEQAFTKSVSSTNANRQYLIYQFPMANEVTTQTGLGVQAPVPGEKFGHMYLKYNADSLRAMGATVTGGIAFAHVACVTASNADKLRQLREPVLHFWTNTNGTTPTFDLYLSMTAGYYFSNGNRTAVGNANFTTQLQTPVNTWKLVAIRLGDHTYKTGSTTYGNINSSEVQNAFYQLKIEEIRIRLRTTKSNGEDELIESNVSNFFISDRVRTDLGAVDITL